MNADVRRGSTRQKEQEKASEELGQSGFMGSVPTELLASSEAELGCFDRVKAKKVREDFIKLNCLHKHGTYISSPLWTIKSHRTQAENNFLFLEPKGKPISEHLSSIMSTFPVMRKLQQLHFLFMYNSVTGCKRKKKKREKKMYPSCWLPLRAAQPLFLFASGRIH